MSKNGNKKKTSIGMPFLRGKKYVYYLRIPAENGKTKTWQSKAFDTYDEAFMDSVARQEMLKNAKAKPSTADKTRVYLDKWLKQHYYYEVKPTTYAGAERNIRLYINPIIGNKPFASVSKSDVERIIHSVEKGHQPSTILNAYHTLSKAFSYAVENGDVIKSPCKGVTLPRIVRERRELLQKDEVTEFLELAKKYDIYLEVLFGLTFGMREGEILGLKFKDFNLRRGTVIPVRQVCRTYKSSNPLSEDIPILRYDVKSSLKTKNSQGRVLNITNEMKTFVNELQDKYISEGLANRATIGECFLFHGEKGTDFRTPEYLKNRFRILRTEFGLNNLRFHDLRHTFASFLIEDGVPIAAVSAALGHASITTTYDSYYDVINSGKEIASKINTIIGAPDIKSVSVG